MAIKDHADQLRDLLRDIPEFDYRHPADDIRHLPQMLRSLAPPRRKKHHPGSLVPKERHPRPLTSKEERHAYVTLRMFIPSVSDVLAAISREAEMLAEKPPVTSKPGARDAEKTYFIRTLQDYLTQRYEVAPDKAVAIIAETALEQDISIDRVRKTLTHRN